MKDIFLSIKRTPYQSLASFLILFLTLTLSLFIFTIHAFFYGILGYVETRPQVVAYFNVNTKEKDILAIKNELASSGKTSQISYISQAEALSIYKELNKDNPLLLEMVSADILPASLEIYAKRPEYLPQIAAFLKNKPAVDEVNFQKDIVSKLLTLTNALRKISVAIFSMLVVISITVLMTTTAFKISIKKDEIELLNLLGATKFFIRKPFLIEGVIFGATSGAVSFFLLFGVFMYFKPFLENYLLGIPPLPFYSLGKLNLYVWPPSPNFFIFSFILITLFGAFIGFIGNYIATSKYIK